jgi:hypothetical protein
MKSMSIHTRLVLGLSIGIFGLAATVGATPTGQREVYNVKDYGAVGDGSTNDAAEIDAAFADAVGDGGGVVYFPRGTYLYQGTGTHQGLVNNPTGTVPIVIQGDGPRVSGIVVDSISNAEFIKLSSQSSMGGWANQGSGVRDISIQLGENASVDAITINNLELALVENVNVAYGRNAVNVVESRLSTFRNINIERYGGSAIKMTGATYATNWFEDIQISGYSAQTPDWGFEYVHTGAAPVAGPTLYNVIVNGVSTGGFRFEHSGSSDVIGLFLFLNNCVADGSFSGDAFLFKQVNAIYLSNNFAVNHASGGTGFTFDKAYGVSQVGGVAYADGSGGSDFEFRNQCKNIVLSGVSVTGWQKTYTADNTSHENIVLNNSSPPATVQASDYGNLFTHYDTAHIVSTMHILTNASAGPSSEFALRSDANLSNSKYFRMNGSTLEILSNARALISYLTDGGTWNATGFAGAAVSVTGTTASTSTATGSLVNAGGFGNAGAAWFGGKIGTSGTAPTLSSCGTSPSVTGTNTAGELTEGTGAGATGCTLSFSSAYSNAPYCMVTSQAGKAFGYTISTSAIVIANNGDTSLRGTKFNYYCMAR